LHIPSNIKCNLLSNLSNMNMRKISFKNKLKNTVIS
jgi:hypothetical protein